jgi:2-amino-4-hydroxy-6-hydroxymethyldihydropteridine diphosphokinase
MTTVFLGLGGNLGDPSQTLRQAIDEIAALPATRVTAVSSFLRTKPFGVTRRQPSFVNAVVAIDTDLSPDALLTALHRIERAHGRKRPYRFAPRKLDIDILLYGNRIRRGKRVILPHPRLHLRPFALIPLREIAPGVRIAGKSLKCEGWLHGLR